MKLPINFNINYQTYGTNGLGIRCCTYGLGSPGLGLESCTDNFLASHSNARKIIKLITVMKIN